MLKPSVESAINDQIHHELEAAYLYLSMSAHFESSGLPGFAKWMRLQSQEELTHGMKLFDYVHARGGRAKLQQIAPPPQTFGKPIEIARHVLEHEQKVTQLIGKLYETAATERDFVTAAQLQWFLTEQVEEEKIATDLVQRLEIAGDNSNALLVLDRELGSRTNGP
jgi:ferritin